MVTAFGKERREKLKNSSFYYNRKTITQKIR